VVTVEAFDTAFFAGLQQDLPVFNHNLKTLLAQTATGNHIPEN
jgi:hypothetical protein